MAITSQLTKTDKKRQSSTASVRNIVFIDGTVDEARLLWDDLDPATAAVILDPAGDGVVQITQYLQEYIQQQEGGGNLHIVSHGAPGCLYLGNTQLSLDTLEQYWGDLQRWQVDSLLLYGCQVAAGDAGEEFLAKLHAATGANIGASKSKTGNASMGGNWNLEATVGEVRCPVVFSQAVQNAYPGVLSDVNVSITADTLDGDTSSISALIASPGADGGISLREAAIAANNTAGDDRIVLTSGQTYNLSIAGREEDAALLGDLDIVNNGKIAIETTGAGKAAIDAGGIDRVFDVLANASLALDNIEVTGGVTPGSYPHNRGGGIRVHRNGSLELTDSAVSGNSTSYGGGIFNRGNASIENSTIDGNTAAIYGGGISNYGSASIANSTISGNTVSSGGGIANFGSASIANSTIGGNTAGQGGGISNFGSASITNSTLSGNTARSDGGGIFNVDSAVIESSTISGNRASSGGGIFNLGFASITNSTISGNRASSGGGIFNLIDASITNSTVSGNTADEGGGIFNVYSAVIESSTISSNRASSGGGIFNLTDASITNSIIAANAEEKDLHNNSGTFTSDGHNLIGNNNGIAAFTHGVNGDIVGTAASPVDPVLGPLQDNGGGTFTQALLIGSPAINAGNNSSIPTDGLDVDGDGDTAEAIEIDQRGETRIFDGTVDIGAYEYVDRILTVTTTADEADGGTGGSGLSLREAIVLANANAGDFTIVLTGGQTYNLTIAGTLEDAAATGDLDILNNGKIAIQTAGAGTAAIDAGGIDRVFDVLPNASLALDNVRVAGGVASSRSDGLGGGIRVKRNGSLSLTHSTVSGNTAFIGGGIYNDGTASIGNSTIGGNTAVSAGGIMNLGTASIGNSTIGGNSAVNFGGGLWNYSGDAIIANSTLSGNTARSGAGIYNKGNASITNSTIGGNSASDEGGGIFNYSKATIANSTISGNEGVGLFNLGNAFRVRIANSIIAANADNKDLGVQGGSFPYEAQGEITSDGHNLIGNKGRIAAFADGVKGDIVGTAASPVDPGLGPLQDNGGGTFTQALLIGSPAINAGNNSSIPTDGLDVDGDGDTAEAIEIDQRGETRIFDGTVDIGAYEYADDRPQTGIRFTPADDAMLVSISENLSIDFNENVAAGTGEIRLKRTRDDSVFERIDVTGSAVTVSGDIVTIDPARDMEMDTGYYIEIDAGAIVDSEGNDYEGIADSSSWNWTTRSSTLTVTTTADEVDGGAGGSGLSLREAILLANEEAGDFTLVLTSGQTYNLSIAGREEDAALLGDLDIVNNGKIAIETTGAGKAAIDAGGIDRVFEVLANASLALDNIEVTGGVTSGSYPHNRGGGIRVHSNGSLELTDSAVSGNSTSYGGGIFNRGSASIENSTIDGNTAAIYGGGISNYGTVSIENSTISGNTVSSGGGIANFGSASIANSTIGGNTAGQGGGISNFGSASITNSTLSGNTADEGGGIFNVVHSAVIESSTISGNTADEGGGIFNLGFASITNSTISGNRASSGGGIFNLIDASITNSIIAANAEEKDLHNNSGTFTSDGHNLIGNNNGIAAFTHGVNGDIVGTAASPVDPVLGPLQDNGGGTFTQALLTGSPAINAGNNSSIPTDGLDVDGDGDTAEAIEIDQRGETRISDGTVDIGAYEVLSAADAQPYVANAIADLSASEDDPDERLDLSMVFADPDNDDGAIVKSIQTNTNTSLVTARISGNTLTLDYMDNQSGTAEITVKGISNGQTVTDTFTVTVAGVEDPPIAAADSYNVAAGATLEIPVPGVLANDRDVEGATLTATQVTPPSHGTLTLSSDGSFVYVHDNGSSSFDSFTYKANDGTLDSTPVTVNITIDPLNEFVGGPGNDRIVGTSLHDRILGGRGRDTLVGDAGNDQFVYTGLTDAGDIISDFTVGEDKIVLGDLFASLGISSDDLATAKSGGFLSFVERTPDTILMVDPDGTVGGGRRRPFLLLKNVAMSALEDEGNFIF